MTEEQCKIDEFIISEWLNSCSKDITLLECNQIRKDISIFIYLYIFLSKSYIEV